MKPAALIRIILQKVEMGLNDISDEEAKAISAKGKWSYIQIMGHLIDSAINNLGRFIRAQQSDDLLFDGYAQEFWVKAQNYQEADWEEVMNLFYFLNMQIARTVAHIPDEVMKKARTKHSVSWPLYVDKKASEPMTLEFLVLDYVAHMENHLLQILPDYESLVLKKS